MRRALGALAVVALSLAMWSCRELLVDPGTGATPGTARTLRITPSRLDLRVGASASVTATLLDATGAVVPMPAGFALAFSSSVPTVFSADAGGLVTGLGDGEGVLRASVGALVVGIPVGVVSVEPRLVIVSGDAQTGAPGAQLAQPLVVRAELASGKPGRDAVVDFTATEGSVSPVRASTDSNGAATVRWAIGPTAGVQSMTARAKGFASVTFVATAVKRPVARVVVLPDTVKLTDVAQTAQLSASASDADGQAIPGGGFTWASSNAAVATVSQSGLVTAVGAGSSIVAATLGSISGSSTITVTLPVPQSRLAFRPDTLRAAVVAGAQVVAAVDVLDAGGLPAEALGAVSCDTPTYDGAPPTSWLVVQSCGDSVRVLVQAAALPAGTWRASIPVRGTLASNSPAALPVQVVVSAAPLIVAAPSGQLTVNTTLGADDGIFSRVVEITNGGGGVLTDLAASATYAAGQPTGWIEKLALDSARAPTALRFSVRRGALLMGRYGATLRLTSTVAGVPPLDIPVEMVVKASAARLGLSRDSVEGISYTNGPAIRVAVDVVERGGLGEAALGPVSCAAPEPPEFFSIVSCGDSIVAMLSPGGNLTRSEVAVVKVTSAFTTDTVTLRLTRTASQPRLRLVPDSLASRSQTNGTAVRMAADLVIDVPPGAPAYPEASLGTLQCTVQSPAGAPAATIAQCADSIAIAVTPGADTGTFRYTVDVQAPNAAVTAVRVVLPVTVSITAAPLPVIAAFPSGPLSFTTTYGADTGVFHRVVDITNGGTGTLTGLATSLTYAAGQPTGWIENLALDALAAPTALRFTVRRGTLPVGAYDATVRVASTVAGVQPMDIAVRVIVQSVYPRLVIVSGDAQTGTAGAELALPLVVRADTAEGRPGRDGVVTFTAAEGSATPARVSTDGFGVASTRWTLGPTVGVQTITAQANGYPTVTFVATAVPTPLAHIGLSPDSIAIRSYTGGPGLRGAVAVVERSGRGLDALGTISCSAVQFGRVTGWAGILSCRDSVKVWMDTDTDLNGTDYATIRVTGSTAADTATLRLQLTASRPRLVINPDSLLISTMAGAAPVSATARVAEADGWFTAAQMSDLRCTLTVPAGAPPAAVTSCTADAVTLTVSPNATSGGFVYSVLVEAPNGPTTITAALLRVVATIGAGPPVIVASPAGPITLTTTYGLDNGDVRAVVNITNAGGEALTGLAVRTVLASGQRDDWVETLRLEGTTAPTVLHLDALRGTLPAGTYDLTLRITSTVAGVLPLDIPVRFVVQPNPARIGVSPDSIVVRSFTGGPPIRAAVAVVELTGLGRAALGNIVCSPVQFVEGGGWAVVETCGDSVVVLLNTDNNFNGTDHAIVRVTGSAVTDTATLHLKQTAYPPRLVLIPDSLGIATTAGAAPVAVSSQVVEGSRWLTSTQIGALRCIVSPPAGAPAAAVTSCTADAVTLSVSPDATSGTFLYGVIVEAPNSVVPTDAGYLRVGVVIAPAPPPPAPFVAGAIYGRCASDPAGQLFCWGNNTSGEVGDGTTDMRVLPARVGTASDPIVAVSSGNAMTCGLAGSPLVAYCWGGNASGATGQGTYLGLNSTPQPVKNPNIYGYRLLSAGTGTVCGAGNTGDADRIFCWGNNEFGQLGNGSIETSTNVPGAPVALTAEQSVTDVAVGWKHACAIAGQAPYRLYCWGEGWLLGNGTTDASVQPTPVAVSFPDDLPSRGLVAGAEATCLLNYGSSGLYCWGSNRNGETGTGGTSVVGVPTPVRFPGLPDAVYVLSVAAGANHTCAIAAGATYCWGRNEYGQLASGTFGSPSDVPQRISGDRGFYALAAAGNTTCGFVLGDSSVWCWGYGETGELGNGTSGINSAVPVQVRRR